MLKKSLLAIALASSVFAVGCGGSSSSSPSGGSGGGGTTARNDVAGPLDAVQEPVSSQVLAPLATAAAGTPLAGVVTCVDQIVVADTLDIIDTLAAQADAGAPDFEASATAVQDELTDLVADLQTLLTSLAGGSGCSGSTVPAPGGFGTNPLAGTPLEDFGATLLAALETAQGQLGGGGGTPDLGSLSDVVAQLSAGYNSALLMAPAEATAAPIVGPALGLIGTALEDLTTTVAAAESADANATSLAVSQTVDNLLSSLLLEVVPITTLEDQANASGQLSGPIADAIDQLTAAIAGGFGDLGGAGLPTEVEGLLSLLTDPGTGTDPTGLLTGLLVEIAAALGSGDTGALPIPDVGGSSLDTALAELTTLLASAGETGTPLDDLVDTVTGLLGGLLGIG